MNPLKRLSPPARIALMCMSFIAILTLLHSWLHPMIQRNKQNAEYQVLNNLLNENDLRFIVKPVSDGDLLQRNNTDNLYIAFRDTTAIAVILPVSVQGYRDRIDLLIGLRRDGSITSIHVEKTQETKGLGGQISQTDHPWFKQFTQRSLNQLDLSQWLLKKDNGYFDHITGATITSRATVDAITRAKRYFNKHQQTLFTSTLDTAL